MTDRQAKRNCGLLTQKGSACWKLKTEFDWTVSGLDWTQTRRTERGEARAGGDGGGGNIFT